MKAYNVLLISFLLGLFCFSCGDDDGVELEQEGDPVEVDGDGSGNGGGTTFTPVVDLSKNNLSFQVEECVFADSIEFDIETVDVLNVGDGELGELSHTVIYGGDVPDWLMVNQIGTSLQIVPNEEIMYELFQGNYLATVKIYAENAANGSDEVLVNLNVQSGNKGRVYVLFHVEEGFPLDEKIHTSLTLECPVPGSPLISVSQPDMVPFEGVFDGYLYEWGCSNLCNFSWYFSTDECDVEIPDVEDQNFQLEAGEIKIVDVYIGCQ